MEYVAVLKAISDKTRMKILRMLLERNCCVRALARNLNLTEATISQHLKVLRNAGLILGKRKGYYVHYDVQRSILRGLALTFEELAGIERELCTPEKGRCNPSEHGRCHIKGKASEPKRACRVSGPKAKCRCHRSEDK